ncbi:hypothetical protein PWT90_02844 [Aphanocladium album]|nr:hypothetical protein PWT90_02844 [Aphanocladium album]
MVSPTSSSSSTTTVIACRHGPAQAGQSATLPLRTTPLQCSDTTKEKEEEEEEEEVLGDSGYGSNESTQTASSSNIEDAGKELPLSKSKSTRYFPGRLSEEQISRFYAIIPSVERLLAQHLARKTLLGGCRRHKPMVIRPMLLGAAMMDAKPHIVVFCASEMRKRVKKFLDTDELVRACCKPENCPDLPTFGVAVCGFAPDLRGGDVSVNVVWDTEVERPTAATLKDKGIAYSPLGPKTQFNDTVCGTPIQFHANGMQSNATLGGIIQLIYEDGSWDLKGLTAAHSAVALLQNDWLNDDSLILDDDEEDGSSSTHTGDDYCETDCEDASMVDFSDLAHKEACVGNQSDNWAFENPQSPQQVTLADSVLSAVQGHPSKDASFFDWVLIPLSVLKENKLPQKEFNGQGSYIQACRLFSSQTTRLSSEAVKIICGSGGVRYGRLVPEPSRILVSPGSVFVTAYMIELSGDSLLSDGDSGSWVISELHSDLLGQIVATDLFGAAYFIAAQDILDDIARSSMAEMAVMPTIVDMRLAQAHLEMASRETQEPHSSKDKQAIGAIPSSVLHTIEDLDHFEHPAEAWGKIRTESDESGPTAFSVTTSSPEDERVLRHFIKKILDIPWFQCWSVSPDAAWTTYRFGLRDPSDAPSALILLQNLLGHVGSGQSEEKLVKRYAIDVYRHASSVKHRERLHKVATLRQYKPPLPSPATQQAASKQED